MDSAAIPYLELFNTFKKGPAPGENTTSYPSLGAEITRHKFSSAGAFVLPGAKEYHCAGHRIQFGPDKPCAPPEYSHYPELLKIPDIDITCNKEFEYLVMNHGDNRSYSKAIIIFHGLNEKKWDKYLPWAYRLLKNTGKAVVLFPLAFHMDRAPLEWTEQRIMKQAAESRMKESRSNSHTSFVNAAISTRLEEDPRRFFWTGLQSFMDVRNLLKHLKDGAVAGFAPGTSADIMAYSIGAFFSLILIMADPEGMLSASRLFLFCGGATLDRMYPISRYILDARAASRLNSFYLEHVNNGFAEEDRLRHYLDKEHSGASYFNMLLLYHHRKAERESCLRKLAPKVSAVALKQDTVVPPAEILNTLKGEMRDIEIPVEVLDFPYPYTHVTPFTLQEKFSKEASEAFNQVMNKAGEWLS